MSSVDERVVQLRMENNQFEREANNTMHTLSKLKDSFSSFGSSLGKNIDFSSIQKGIDNVSFGALQNGIDTTVSHFNKLEVVATDALVRIARKAEDMAVSMVKALSVDQVMTGLNEYEMKLDTIQVILANTQGASTLEDVKRYLEELNEYSDKTIYNFGQMTQNIGRFTAAGVNLEDSVTAIKGLSNLSALVGANSEQNARAMYNLSQALSVGKMQLVDWKSFENAGGLGGKLFRDELVKTAEELGHFKKSWSTANGEAIEGATLMKQALGEEGGAFRETLKYGWVDADVMITTLQKFADESTELGQQAYEAATKVRTFTKLVDTLKESVQSGWAQSWEIIIGDYEAAPVLWSKVNDVVGGYLEKQAEARNADLKAWAEYGGREQIINGLSNAYEALSIILGRLGDTFDRIFNPDRLSMLKSFSEKFESFTSNILGWVKAADATFPPLQKDVDTAVEHFGRIKEYLDKFDMFDSLLPDGKTVRTVFGNIDILKRKTLDYSEAAREASESAVKLWYGDDNHSLRENNKLYNGLKTLGFDSIKEGIEVSYTPVLETPNGLEVLTESTVTDYLNTLIEKSIDGTNGEIDRTKLFEIDETGFQIYGKHIHGLVAEIGDEAANVYRMINLLTTEDDVLKTFDTLDKIDFFTGKDHTAQDLADDVRQLKKADKASAKLKKSADKLAEVLDEVFKGSNNSDDRLAALEEALKSSDSFLSADQRDPFNELLKKGLVDLKNFTDKELKLLGYTDRQINNMRSNYTGPGYKYAEGSADELRSEQKELKEIIRENEKANEAIEEAEEDDSEKPLDHFAQMVVKFFNAYEEVMNIVHELWGDFLTLKDVAVQLVKDIVEGFDYGISTEEFTNVAHIIVHRITEMVEALKVFVNQPEIRDKIIEIASGFASFFGILMKFKLAKWQIMISAFQWLATNVGPALVDAFHKIGRAFNELNARLGETNIIGRVAGAISGFFDDSQTAVSLADVISNAINLIADGIVFLIEKVGDLAEFLSSVDFTPFLDTIRNLNFDPIAEWFDKFSLSDLANKINSEGIIGTLSGFFTGIKDFFTKDLFAGITGDDGTFGLTTIIGDAVTKVSDFIKGIEPEDIWNHFVGIFTGVEANAAELDNPYAAGNNPYAQKSGNKENLYSDSDNPWVVAAEKAEGQLEKTFSEQENKIMEGVTVFLTKLKAFVIEHALDIVRTIGNIIGIRTLMTFRKTVIKAIESLSTLIKTPSKLVEGINKSMERVSKGVAFNEISEGFLKLAGAIGILAGAIFALSKINDPDLERTLSWLFAISSVAAGMTVVFSGLMNLANGGSGGDSGDGLFGGTIKKLFGGNLDDIFGKHEDPTKKFKNIAIGIAAIAGSFVMLGASFKIFSTFDSDVFIKGFGVIAGFFTSIWLINKAINKNGNGNNILKIGASIALITVALNALIVPLVAFGLLMTKFTGATFAGIGGIFLSLLAIIAPLTLLGRWTKNVPALALSIIGFAAALNLLIVPIAALGLVMKHLNGWEGILATFAILGVFMAAMAAFSSIKGANFGSLLVLAAGIAAMAASLTLLSIPLLLLGVIARKNWIGLVVAAAAIGGLVAAFRFFDGIFPHALAFAGALIVVSAGIFALGAAIRYFTGKSLNGLDDITGGVVANAAELDDVAKDLNVADDIKDSLSDVTDTAASGLSDLGSTISDGTNDAISSVKKSVSGFDLGGTLGNMFSGLSDSLGALNIGDSLGIESLVGSGLNSLGSQIGGFDLGGSADSLMGTLSDGLGSWTGILGEQSGLNIESIVGGVESSVLANLPTIKKSGAKIIKAFISGEEEEVPESPLWEKMEHLDPDTVLDYVQKIAPNTGQAVLSSLIPNHVDKNGEEVFAGIIPSVIDAYGNATERVRVWLDKNGNIIPEESIFDGLKDYAKQSISGFASDIKETVDKEIEDAGGIGGILSSLFTKSYDNENLQGWEAVKMELVKGGTEIGLAFVNGFKGTVGEKIGNFFADLYTKIATWLEQSDMYITQWNKENGELEQVLNPEHEFTIEEVTEGFANNTKDAFGRLSAYAKQKGKDVEEVRQTVLDSVDDYKEIDDYLNMNPLDRGIQNVVDIFTDIGKFLGIVPEDVEGAELTPEEQATLLTQNVTETVTKVDEKTVSLVERAKAFTEKNSADLNESLKMDFSNTGMDPEEESEKAVTPIRQTVEKIHGKLTEILANPYATGPNPYINTLTADQLLNPDAIIPETESIGTVIGEKVTSKTSESAQLKADIEGPKTGGYIADKVLEGARSKSDEKTPTVANGLVSLFSTTATNEENSAKNKSAGASMADKVFEGINEKSSESVNSTATNVVNGLLNAIRQQNNENLIKQAGQWIGLKLKEGTEASLNINSPSKEYEWITNMAIMGILNEVKNDIGLLTGAGEDIGDTLFSSFKQAADAVTYTMSNDITPTITPVVDLSQIQNGVNSIDGQFNRGSVRLAAEANLGFADMRSQIYDSMRAQSPINYRNELYSLHNDITSLNQAMSNMQVRLDTGALVGGMRSQMNSTLGSVTSRRIRGL